MAVVSYFSCAASPQTTSPVWPHYFRGIGGEPSLWFSPI